MAKRAAYTVNGMTCDHCVGTVSEVLRALPGVTDVDVDVELGSGSVAVVSAGPVPDGAVREAVRGAGYTVAD